MNNKTKKLNKIKSVLFSFIFFIYNYSFIIIIILLFQGITESDSFLALCDNGNNSIEEFLVDPTCESENNYNNCGKPISKTDSLSYIEPNSSYILDEYKTRARRKIYWLAAQKYKGNYSNYEEFKKSWNPNMNILSELKKQLKSEIGFSLPKLSVNQRTFYYFIKGRKPGGGRGL